MTYCTRLDLENRFGTSAIADLEYDRPGAVDEAIGDAASKIDSYLGARYSLPLVSVPDVLKQVARDLVRYELDIDPDDTVTKRKESAEKYLQRLAEGKATLGVPQAEEPASLDTAEILSGGNVFNRSDKSFL